VRCFVPQPQILPSGEKAMKYSDFDNRKYANWKDVVTTVVATVEEVRVEVMPRTKDRQLVLFFPEDQFRYAVILNKTRREALARITGSDDPEDAVGVTIELFNDSSVRNPQTGEYGSIAIRRPPVKRKPVARPAPKSLDEVNAEASQGTFAGNDDEPII
jgi:hypothetical protein